MWFKELRDQSFCKPEKKIRMYNLEFIGQEFLCEDLTEDVGCFCN